MFKPQERHNLLGMQRNLGALEKFDEPSARISSKSDFPLLTRFGENPADTLYKQRALEVSRFLGMQRIIY